MPILLHIDSSPRGNLSRSRKLAQEFVEKWKACNPKCNVIYRDLRYDHMPHITEEWINANYTPLEAQTSEMAKILKFSNELVDELLIASHYVFSVPMYNWSIPSCFKAYIDNIVRLHRTVAFENNCFKGLTKDKKVVFITARGEQFFKGSRYENWDAQVPALQFPFEFIGVEDIKFINVNGLDAGDEIRKMEIQKACTKIQKLVINW